MENSSQPQQMVVNFLNDRDDGVNVTDDHSSSPLCIDLYHFSTVFETRLLHRMLPRPFLVGSVSLTFVVKLLRLCLYWRKTSRCPNMRDFIDRWQRVGVGDYEIVEFRKVATEAHFSDLGFHPDINNSPRRIWRRYRGFGQKQMNCRFGVLCVIVCHLPRASFLRLSIEDWFHTLL